MSLLPIIIVKGTKNNNLRLFSSIGELMIHMNVPVLLAKGSLALDPPCVLSVKYEINLF